MTEFAVIVLCLIAIQLAILTDNVTVASKKLDVDDDDEDLGV